ncbi:LOW QUALITY PROTEIN: Deoxyribodipyrimidine photo-lyase [Phytophthora palmivora]|uniref:Deoxyribodipyrimidine photo-lyase n=1 Tax=Phytophthora palmivora TaxID=4796 RepID=A0A2P4Y8W4_9STRA|nr:LOW QUALITY PROTEIN: Deoxyribodipyrimidine photo-lyase [Phytophthora palmivora]
MRLIAGASPLRRSSWEIVACAEQVVLEAGNHAPCLRVERTQVLDCHVCAGVVSTEYVANHVIFIAGVEDIAEALVCWAHVPGASVKDPPRREFPLRLACCAPPPRRKEWDVSAAVTPETAAMRSSTRFTYGGCLLNTSCGWCAKSSCVNRVVENILERDVRRERVIAAWSCMSGRLSMTSVDGAVCISIASAMASMGHVSNSVPGNIDNPCSSDIFIRMKRTKSTLPASMEMLDLRGGRGPRLYRIGTTADILVQHLGSHLNNSC